MTKQDLMAALQQAVADLNAGKNVAADLQRLIKDVRKGVK